ncbi:MAG: saccharopine dehydrogenase, partial [Thermoprotei archaeon]
GEIKEVDPLSHIEEIDLGPLGKFEAIYTDGLRTLLKTIKAKNMVEKTIRYPGHFSKIRVLKDLGFLSSRKIRIGEEIITPKEFSAKILEEALRSFDFRDLVIMRIRVSGKKNGRSFIYQFDMVDKFDPQTNLTAMARTTGFTCAIAARLVAKGLIDTGVQPLEKIGSNMKLYGIFIEGLAKRGIKVAERAL